MSTERMIRQYKAHTQTLSTGDKVISLPGHVYDLFFGKGWTNRVRFRLVKQTEGKITRTVVHQLSGMTLADPYKILLSEEIHCG